MGLNSLPAVTVPVRSTRSGRDDQSATTDNDYRRAVTSDPRVTRIAVFDRRGTAQDRHSSAAGEYAETSTAIILLTAVAPRCE